MLVLIAALLLVSQAVLAFALPAEFVAVKIASLVFALAIGAAVYAAARFVTYPTLTVISDELERARAHAKLETEKVHAQFRALFDGTDVGMALIGASGEVIESNTAMQEMLGYSGAELGEMQFGEWIHPDELPAGYAFAGHFRIADSPLTGRELRCRNKAGADLWVEIKISEVSDASGETHLAIGMIQDASKRVQAQTQLRFEADHDALTGLANRLHFRRVLDGAFQRGKKEAGKRDNFAVLFVDLDHFKFVNDSLGHAAGDTVLKVLSERLLNCARNDDVVARLGGDEFAILLTSVQGMETATRIAERVQQEVALPIDLEGRLVYMSASIGITQGNSGYNSADELLRDADTAAYRAKSLGRARHVVFDQEMHEQAADRLQMSSDLTQAFEEQQFRLVYQPIIDLHEKRCAGFEALLRWNHPFGNVPPADFIPVAEETGLIIKLGTWALREACAQLAHWRKRYGEASPMTMSVNVSPQQIVQPGFDRIVGQILGEFSLPGEALILEITESVIIDGARLAASVVEGLNELGVRLCIDDFGTGYSSLVYLERLPIDALKIDKGFVNGPHGLLQSEQIVRMVLRLGDSLKMRVIAEGVETKQQLVLLNKMQCRYVQGYLFSKPVEPTAIETTIFGGSELLLGAEFNARFHQPVLRPA